jgi:Dockerin type I domain
MKWTIISTLLFFACSGMVMASRHQIGAAASGRAKTADSRLESVLGQNLAGTSGAMTSGFLFGSSKPYYLPGDANGSGDVNISDAVFLVSYIFGGGTAPVPLNRGDANCDGRVNISDAVFLISYIFSGGGAPQNCR